MTCFCCTFVQVVRIPSWHNTTKHPSRSLSSRGGRLKIPDIQFLWATLCLSLRSSAVRVSSQLEFQIPLWCGVAFNEEFFSHMLILARNKRSVVLRCASSNFRRTALFLWSNSTTLKLRSSGPVTFPTSNNEWHTRHRLRYRKSGLMVWMRPEQICKQVAAVWGNVWTHHCNYQ